MVRERKYLSAEISLLPDRTKKWSVRAAHIFPNTYAAGMSNLGYLAVFEVMHRFWQFFPQRFFGAEPFSLETGENLAQFPIISVSLSFEPDFLNLVRMFRRAGVPLRAERREQLVILGGAGATINPYPYSPFADAIFIGEGTEYIEKIFAILAENPVGWVPKAEILPELAKIPGVWVPTADSQPPPRAISKSEIPPAGKTLSSFASFPNMVLVQIQRGCLFACPFCATPVIYNPFKNFSAESIISALAPWEEIGYSRVGLVGSAIADHPELGELLDYFAARDVEVFTSSLRVDRLTDELLKKLAHTTRHTVTFAPETGSPHLKRQIRKDISAEGIISASAKIPVREIKLYYIVGLPGETEEDVRLTGEEIKTISRALGDRKIVASVNPFIPKRGTRWGDFPMMSHQELVRRFGILKKILRGQKNVIIDVNYKRRTRIQWALSVGGREVGEAFLETDNVSEIISKLQKMGWDI